MFRTFILSALLIIWLPGIFALPEEHARWCTELGLEGECQARAGCHCYCAEKGSLKQIDSAYFGEYGYDLISNVPVVYNLWKQGMLRKTVGPPGSRHLYFFSPNHTEVDIIRTHCNGITGRNNHDRPFGMDDWTPPPIKDHYAKIAIDNIPAAVSNIIKKKKPLVIVHNKYNIEWGGPPINFLPASLLSTLFEVLKPYYTIVYIRPSAVVMDEQGLTDDKSELLDLPGEFDVLKKHPEVWTMDKLLVKGEQGGSQYADLNWIQLILHSHANHFISVQGGTAILASYFSGINIVYCAEGLELSEPNEFDTVFKILSDAQILHTSDYRTLLNMVIRNFAPELKTRSWLYTRQFLITYAREKGSEAIKSINLTTGQLMKINLLLTGSVVGVGCVYYLKRGKLNKHRLHT